MKNKIRLICITGIFTALIFIFTAYVHIPSHTGYTHIGDAFIYLAACLLPYPYAMIAGSAGALFADLFTGYAIWAPASVIIKALYVLFFSRRQSILSVRSLVALFPSALICIGGYYLYEAIITANLIAPLAGIPGYVIQSASSSVVFLVLGAIFDKAKLRERILK